MNIFTLSGRFHYRKSRMQKELGFNFSQYIFVNVSALTAYLFGEMGKSLLIFCSVLIVISAFAGNGGLAFRTTNGDFSDVLDLLNERHEVQEPETEETEFDESEVETRDVVIPQTTIPEVSLCVTLKIII